MITTQILGFGVTPEEAGYNFGATSYITSEPFLADSGNTIDFVIWNDDSTSGDTGYYSNGDVTRYYNGTGYTLTEAVLLPMSYFVSGYCDGLIYKLNSEQLYFIGTLLRIPPTNFCYKVIVPPPPTTSYIILYDNLGAVAINPQNNCDYPECMPCPTPTPTPGPSVTPMPTPTRTPIPVTPVVGQSINLCDPITLLPLGVACLSINPTEESPNSGILSVEITGGTAPYTVVWTMPNGTEITGQTIYNLSAGSYPVTVYDKYLDFMATVLCVIESPLDCLFYGTADEFFVATPTPTATPTQTPTPPPTPTIPPYSTPTPRPTETPTPTPVLCTIPVDFLNYLDCGNSNGTILVNNVQVFSWTSNTVTGIYYFNANIGDIITIIGYAGPHTTNITACTHFKMSSLTVKVTVASVQLTNQTTFTNNPGINYAFTLTDCNAIINLVTAGTF